jgi:hypothetical protein
VLTNEQIDTWTCKLRSGEYKQGRNGLKKGDRFCCLGVLGDILYPERWYPAFTTWALDTLSIEGCEFKHYLPDSTISEAIQIKLGELNDTEEKDFCEIADWIDENLKH